MVCSCCGAEKKTVRGCSCTGGGSHDCLRLLSSTKPVSSSSASDTVATDITTNRLAVAKEKIGGMLAKQGSDGFVMFVRSFSRPKVIKGATLACLETLFDNSDLNQVFVVLCPEDPDYESYIAELKGTRWAHRIIDGIKGADSIIQFLSLASPIGAHVVVADDNISEFLMGATWSMTMATTMEVPSLKDYISLSKAMMTNSEAKLWGLAPSCVYLNARSLLQTTTALGLVYGSFFGFENSHDMKFQSVFGQVRDDVERTLRFYHHAGIFRWCAIGCKKLKEPGCYRPNGGGISATMTPMQHRANMDEAIKGLANEFPTYIVLDSTVKMGFKWKRGKAATRQLASCSASVSDLAVLEADYESYDMRPGCVLRELCDMPPLLIPTAIVGSDKDAGKGGDKDEGKGGSSDEEGSDEDGSDEGQPIPVASSGMQIFVKTPPGKTITLDVDSHYTIDNVKWLIQGKKGYPVKQQRLVFGVKQFEPEDDHYSLEELDIGSGARLGLVLRLNMCN